SSSPAASCPFSTSARGARSTPSDQSSTPLRFAVAAPALLQASGASPRLSPRSSFPRSSPPRASRGCSCYLPARLPSPPSRPLPCRKIKERPSLTSSKGRKDSRVGDHSPCLPPAFYCCLVGLITKDAG